MKRLVPCLFLLAACSPEKKKQEPAVPEPTAAAAVQVDAALLHDYHHAVEQRKKQKNMPAVPALPSAADDSTFLRRACIDLAGRLPQPEEVRAFVADRAPDKHARLTDALTQEAGGAEVRFRLLAEAFRVRDEDTAMITQLREASVKDSPYAEIIAMMICDGHLNQRDGGDAMRTCVETAFSILGVNSRCAMCHDHPFNDRTQMETYEFAACFAGKDAIKVPRDYKYINAKPGDVVRPALPRLNKGWKPVVEGEAKLTQVTQWMTEGEMTKRFALVAAMRVWKELFGMPGQIIDRTVGGVDDEPTWQETRRNCFSTTQGRTSAWIDLEINSPGDFTQATKVMIEEFLACGGRLGAFQRILARTEAYRRGHITPGYAWNECLLPPAPQLRRLPSEVIWKTLTNETDRELPQAPSGGHPLRELGRGRREWTDESVTPLSHALARVMMQGRRFHTPTPQAASVESLFLQLLGRGPGADELTAIQRESASEEDVEWALLNTKEFMFR